MTQENLLRLLIIEDSSNDAELMVRVLRNSGYAVRHTTADNPDDLDDVLQTHPIDLAICAVASTSLDLEQVHDAIKACGRDVPLIALADDHNAEIQLEIMQLGASDLVCMNDLDHLQLVVRRELAGLEIRRKLEISNQLIHESETRYRALLDLSRDAIAYVHDGMHIRSNAAYLDVFGFKSQDEIESTPILDMVAPQDHAKFKEFLRHYHGGEQGVQELRILGLRLDGTAFNAAMIFTPAAIEGESCTQIIVRAALSAADPAYKPARQQDGIPLLPLDLAMHQKVAKEQAQHWVRLIRDALDNNRFNLVYQPIASLHFDTGKKYDVLLRLRDQEGQEILPRRFIPMAQNNRLIASIDRWVILNTVKTLRERRRAGVDVVLFVKVSQISIEDETLLPWLSKLLERAQVPGNRLVFQVSVDATIDHPGGVKTFFNGLQTLDCGFCLEGFGDSENAYHLLEHLPATYLKIDGSIMPNLANSEERQALVKAIVDRVQGMGILTIAQYVEDANTLALLWQTGIDYIQGHFLQQPDAAMNFDFEGGAGGS